MHWDVPERWAVSRAGKGLRKLCTDGCLHIFILTEPLPALTAFRAAFDPSPKSEISAGGKLAKASALLFLWQKVRAASARAEPTPG